MKILRSGPLWIAVYLSLILAPVLVLMTGERPRGGGFWWDFSMLLGYFGLAMMGVQFALTARFKRAQAPFGIDIIYYFHRYLAVAAFLLLMAHVLIVVAAYDSVLGSMDPRRAPAFMTAGRVAVILYLVVIVTSLWRRQLRIDYDRWRLWHGLLSTLALLLSVGHVIGAAHYLNQPYKRWVWIGVALFWVLLIVYVRLLRPLRLLRRPWRVRAVRQEHGRTWTLAVEPEGHRGFGFHPGQFAWLSLGVSPFAQKEHPFSIASAPGAKGRLEFTIKGLGDFTRTIGDTPVGRIAYVDGPYGAFGIDRHPDAAGYVFLAGGVGIAPMMSMLRTLAQRGDRRPHLLFYGNRLWSHVIFREELEELMERLDLRVVHVLGEPPPDWRGEQGLLSQEILVRHLPDNRAHLHYFVCGPTPMIRLVERGLHQLGVSRSRLHSEIFDLA